ncbi:fat-like cadherin-related tumor suppressor homolog isoform X3 [Parasteatoda tepidariorum]|nr:fat-like cadherin-related tumor suppressor homolog isoform X2 [Parasteatoda tepidariorum]
MGLLRRNPSATSSSLTLPITCLVLLISVLYTRIKVVKSEQTLDFTKTEYNATVLENAVGKTYVIPTEKMGIFISDPSLLVRYKIVSGDPAKMFKAESRTVGDFCFLSLRTRTEEQAILNREYQDYYAIGVRAMVTSLYRRSVKLKAHTTVHVHILDTNDLNPFFDKSEYHTTVPEDYPLHKNLLRVTATDPDVGVNGDIYYSLKEPSLQFAIHPTGGFLTLTRPLDYQVESLHKFTVVAEDRGPKFRVAGTMSFLSTATVQIKVTPVNLHAPEIQVKQLPAILEHSDPDIYAIVRVIDPDKGIHGEIDGLGIVKGDPDGYFKVLTGKKPHEFEIGVADPSRELAAGSYSLVLQATDRGTPPKSTTKTVHLKISEATFPVPKFSQSDYDVEIEEVSPIGFPLVRLVATVEKGKNPLFYTIEIGNDEGMFAVDQKTGVLRTSKVLDRERRAYYSLTVSAVDSGRRSGSHLRKGTAIVNIRILDNNDNDPMFNTSSMVVVFDENRSQNSVVCTVHATDADAGDNGYVTYSLANLHPVPFNIDHFTGEIRTTEVLDYETMRRDYLLRVRASDWGSPYRRQAEMTVQVKLQDINDHRPLFERVDCVGQVLDSVPLDTPIITLSALDFDAGSTVRYLMVPVDDDPCFGLNEDKGILKVTCDLSKQSKKDWLLNVSATDSQHFADVMTINLKVVSHTTSRNKGGVTIDCRKLDVTDRYMELLSLGNSQNKNVGHKDAAVPGRYGENRHSPEFLSTIPKEVWINESASIGTEVVAVRARDRDHSYAGLLVYVINYNNEGDDSFKIDLYTGRLIVDAKLDRERTSKYILNITAFDLGKPQKTASTQIVVNIRDVNDNAPAFEKSSYHFVIPENVENGTSVIRLRATDNDEGENARLTYSLEGPAWDRFHVDKDSGLLTVIGALDRESTENYALRVWAKDSSLEKALMSSTVVYIRLEDVNDNPPMFGLSQFWVKVREDLPLGTVVMIMSARDPDLGDGGRVVYEMLGGGTFSVDPQTGVVRLARSLDFEQKQLYNVTIIARDQGDPPLSSVAYLLVEVEDVNENFQSPKFPDFVASGSVLENKPEGTFVTQVTATDSDPPGIDSTITYSIRDGDGVGIFSIDDQGNIRTRAVLDRETSLRYWLTVIAQDRGAVPLTTRLDVYIEVEDENDNTPLTFEPAYYPNIPENSPEGTTVVKMDAFDLDMNPDQRISYEITAGDPQDHFALDTASGLITTTSNLLDRETQAEHVLEVTVSDNGDPPLVSTTRIVVKVLDVNDHGPTFFQRLQRCYIPQMAKQGPTPCQVLASDEDSGPNGDISYVLSEGSSAHLFRIHPKTGVIYSQGPVKGGQQYELLVTASDGGKPSLSSNSRIILEVISIPVSSKSPPVIQPLESQSLVISESEKVGNLVAMIQADDPDGDSLWYSISGGNVGDMFMIQSKGGAVLLARKLKWEVHPMYNLSIAVTDGIYSVSTFLSIKVMSINNYMPEFLEHTYKVQIAENSPVDTEILKLEAFDRDQDKRLLYTIHNSASPYSISKFRLDSRTGILSVAQPLDHETAQRHILTVAVMDSGTPSKRCFTRLEINVFDHNDHAPQFLTSMFEGQVFETAAIGTSVLQVIAIDRDKGKNAQLSYSVVSGNVGGAFYIDPTLGIIQVSHTLDRNSMSEYFLSVRAIDHGDSPLNGSVNVHIIITVSDNAPPKFDKSEYVIELFENGRSETKVVGVTATCRSSVYYEIIDGNEEDSFTINPTSGVILTTKSLDYETNVFFNLTVRSTNMVGTSAETMVLIHVLDRNDNHPYFLETEVVGFVSEAVDADSIVLDQSNLPLVVAAADKDSELNAVLFYKIVEKSANLYFRIDSSTGAISTSQVLDHEKFSNFTFTVQVTDMGKPHLSAIIPATVTIYIADINDCPPQFEHPSYAATVLLPTHQGVVVITVKATDPDTVATTSIKYNIVSGNYGEKFAIDEDTGEIVVKSPEDMNEEYQLVVSASDSEYEASSKVSIKVKESRRSSLRFSKPKYTAKVEENSAKVVTVAVITVIGSSLNEHLSFKILNPSEMFEVGSTSGVVRTKGIPFDRETQNFFTLVVEVKSELTNPVQIAHILVEVTITDVNDNPPIFVNLPYYSVVPMEAQKGYIVRKVHAIDLDLGENSKVHYELVEGDNKTFKVDRNSGEIILLKPVGSQNLDHEIVVAAIDGGNPPMKSTVDVPIRLINRDMPVFPKQYYNISVVESLRSKSAVLTVLADSPEGRQLIYSIVDGNTHEDFGVNFTTDPGYSNGPCIIYVVEELDFETTQYYHLTIRATDSVSGAYADVLVHINIEDVNDNPPVFENSHYSASVSEAVPFGTSILRVNATDRDSGNNQRVQYFIIGNATTFFHVESSEGIVFIKQSLDRERQDSHDFLVMATDSGSPGLSATTTIHIDVIDMNDNPPKFEYYDYDCMISESAQRGQFVTRVIASDPDESDQSKLVYSIVGGNEQQAFAINSITGIITLSNLHQFNNQSMYLLNVSVTDGVYSGYAKVKVNILSENNNSPIFTRTVYEVAVKENLPPGAPITTVKAADTDRGEYGKITYSIESQVYNKIFMIDPETGVLYARISFDRERHKLYEVPIAAFDGGGRPGYSTVRISVTNDNDNAPLFAVAEYRAYVYENTTIGTTVLQVHAIDDDEDMHASSIEYSIYSNNASTITDLFGVSKDLGEVYLKKSVSQLVNQAFQFFIRARDRGVPPQENEVPVNVIIVSSNVVLPKFEQQKYEFFMSEKSPIGTIVSTLNASSAEPIHYGFVPAPIDSLIELHQSVFSISESGKIVLNSALDRESTATYKLVVKAETSLSPPLIAFCDITINVMDENDNRPTFESNPYVLNIAENIAKGTSILKVVAKDADSGTNSEVVYSFGSDVGNTANVFRLDSSTGWITTLTSLDYETVSWYNFSVTAKDKGHPQLTSSTTVMLRIQDYNDNPPEFERQHYDAAIYEHAVPGTVIVTLEIRDADFEPSKNDFYITKGNQQGQFHIRENGEIFINKLLDRENIASYLLEVLVTDGLFVSKTKVAIDVLDTNDNPPICMKSKYFERISEAIPPYSYILTVEATDADDGKNALQLHSLTGMGSKDFVIDSATGIIKTIKNLDREVQSRYSLIAHVQDRGHPDWECKSAIEIHLEDVNDNAPSFTQPIFTVAIAEDVPVGSLISKIHAIDKDLGANRKVSYSFVNNHLGQFEINPKTGIVRLKRPLDRETESEYNLTVQATDHGSPSLSSTVLLSVTVLDVNDNPPEFTNKIIFATVSESVPVNSEIATVHATSEDIGINAEISYSIIGGDEQGVFEISTSTGKIKLLKPLDYEAVRDFFLTIQAVDGGSPPLSNQAVVNVTVTDSNDNAPVFSQPSYRAIIREDATVGSQVIQVLANDADSVPNARLFFSIMSGDDDNYFAMDSTSGYIKVSKALDRETIPNYVLQVMCSDSGIPQLSTTAFVNIDVSDVNDNAPMFSQSNYSIIIQEGRSIGFTALKFDIVDADASPNTDPYSLEILSGNEDNAFRLVQQDSSLRTATKFNHKKKDTFVLHIKVSDNGSPSLSSDTRVTAMIIEDSQFPPTVFPLEVVINSFRDEFPGGVMGRIHATDGDPYDKLHYEVVSPYKDLFSVDREDGTLVANPGLDVGSYNVNVSVTDGKFTSYGIILVQVNMVSEDAVKNSIGMRLKNITPEDFIMNHRKNFLKGLQSALSIRSKDIDILSIQPAEATTSKVKREVNRDLDVLFAVRKNSHSYYPVKQLMMKFKEKQSLFETSSNLKVVKIIKDRCTSDRCIHGECVDRIVLDETYVVSITTKLLGYVSPQHVRKLECVCKSGYGGNRCDIVINECARNPCSSHHVCFPHPADLGYICQCPPGKTGPLCDRDKTKVCRGSNCYEEKNPISYNGKSYARYSLANPFERHLSIAVSVRTVQATGNLMYAAGIRDYSILEIVNGYVQYRFDCGSGEGLVRVEHPQVNDGLWHDVCVERRGNAAEVIVDKVHRSSGNAPGVHDILNLDGNDIYFGAEVRHHPAVFGYEDIRMGFVGCMDDIRIDEVSLPLHVAGGNNVVTLRRFANVQFQCAVLFDPGVCGSQPCANGGACNATGNSFTCQCLARFLGPRCEIDTNPCASNPCLNGATCHNVNNTFHCDCPEGLSGKRCGYGRYCNPNPCHNGGVCEEGTYGPLCKCKGFYGDICQYDVNECQANPCANGATCENFDGSFRCQCPHNVTGTLCSELLYTNSITSTRWNTTIEEIVGITVVVIFIMLLAVVLACCWRIRHKRRQRRSSLQLEDEPGPNEFMLKNSIIEKDNVKRVSKISNLDATFTTPPLPPRPVSYTPSTQESLSVLAKFDTVHSYGSAAEDLDGNTPRYGGQLFQNISTHKSSHVSVPPSLTPPPPSSSDSDSLLKAGWETDLNSSKEKIYEDKIQNNLNPVVVNLPNEIDKKIKHTDTTPFDSVVDSSGYLWDVSDWSPPDQSINNNFIDESPTEGQDSSSVQSTDSNSFVSQIEMIPDRDGNACQKNVLSNPNLKPSPSRHKIENNKPKVGESLHSQFLENDGSPPPSYDSKSSEWADFSDDEQPAYGFPKRKSHGFRKALESSAGRETERLCYDNIDSDDASLPDLSGRVCELEDSEVDICDVETLPPPKNYNSVPSYV